MKHLRTILLLAMAASVLFVAQPSSPAGAKTESDQTTTNKVPATTFNPATDKLDRTKAGPITHPMIVEIAYNTYFLNEYGMDA